MKKAIAIFLLFNILTSSVGMTFATHYCGGQIAEFQVTMGEKNIGCGMIDEEKPCPNKNNHQTKLKSQNCCENKYQSSDSDETIIKDSYDGVFTPKLFVQLHLLFEVLIPEDTEQNSSNLTYYSPPLEQDIPVLIQSFLL